MYAQLSQLLITAGEVKKGMEWNELAHPQDPGGLGFQNYNRGLAACRTERFRDWVSGVFGHVCRAEYAVRAPSALRFSGGCRDGPLSVAVDCAPGLPAPVRQGRGRTFASDSRPSSPDSIRRELYRARAVKIAGIRAPT